jgi:pantothenate kinase-related protein Tda10
MQADSPDQDDMTTPKSVKTTKKDLHLKKLSTIVANFPIENCKTFVVGISGGDCSGKKELINFMFDKN